MDGRMGRWDESPHQLLMHTVSIDEAVSVARCGDIIILFDNGDKTEVDGIGWFIHGDSILHACLAIDSLGRVVSATGDGVDVCGLVEIAREDARAVVRRPRTEPINRVMMVTAALRRINSPYGRGPRGQNILSVLLKALLSWWRKSDPKDRISCVGLISAAAASARVDIGIHNKIGPATPADLLFSDSLDTVFP